MNTTPPEQFRGFWFVNFLFPEKLSIYDRITPDNERLKEILEGQGFMEVGFKKNCEPLFRKEDFMDLRGPFHK